MRKPYIDLGNYPMVPRRGLALIFFHHTKTFSFIALVGSI